MARQEGVVIVTIHEAMQELSSFVERNRPFFPKLNLTTPRPLDAKIFPDEWSQVRPPQNGMYVIFRSESQEIVYVGIAASVERRIYEHIGPGFSWARSGSQCNFPNMALAAQRPWLAAQTQDLLRRGDFRVQVIAVTPPECSALLEAFVIARAFVKEGRRPEVNAGFRRVTSSASMKHSPTSAMGTGWESTPWHATQRAAWEALRKAEEGER